jgi:hypothetical protein
MVESAREQNVRNNNKVYLNLCFNNELCIMMRFLFVHMF